MKGYIPGHATDNAWGTAGEGVAVDPEGTSSLRKDRARARPLAAD